MNIIGVVLGEEGDEISQGCKPLQNEAAKMGGEGKGGFAPVSWPNPTELMTPANHWQNSIALGGRRFFYSHIFERGREREYLREGERERERDALRIVHTAARGEGHHPGGWGGPDTDTYQQIRPSKLLAEKIITSSLRRPASLTQTMS